jgi:hypothetical protein
MTVWAAEAAADAGDQDGVLGVGDVLTPEGFLTAAVRCFPDGI